MEAVEQIPPFLVFKRMTLEQESGGFPVANPNGGQAPPPPPLFWCGIEFFTMAYEQEIGLKMMNMAILETRIFKIFWGSMSSDPLGGSLAPTAPVVSPLPPFENARSAPSFQCVYLSANRFSMK